MPLTIMIPKALDKRLALGQAIKVRVNRQPVRLRKKNGHLRYTDRDGRKHSCKIFATEEAYDVDGQLCVSYGCASDAAEARDMAKEPPPKMMYSHPRTGKVSAGRKPAKTYAPNKDSRVHITHPGSAIPRTNPDRPEDGVLCVFGHLTDESIDEFMFSSVLPARPDLEGRLPLAMRVEELKEFEVDGETVQAITLVCADITIKWPVDIIALDSHFGRHLVLGELVQIGRS